MKKSSKKISNTKGTLTLEALKRAYNAIIESPNVPTSIYFEGKLYKIGSKNLANAIRKWKTDKYNNALR